MNRRWLLLTMIVLAGCPSGPAPTTDAANPVDASTPPDAGAHCVTDHECDDGHFCNGVETCAPASASANAMGCVAATPPCMASQQCDEATMRCVTACALHPDADMDGVDSIDCGGTDCDDADPHRFPTNPEVCDAAGHDEDCDPTTFGTRDADGDGAIDAACCNTDTSGAQHCGTDCADQRADARPGLPEPCDGIDNDCDGSIDEGTSRAGAPDRDFDLHGDSTATPIMGCPGDPGFSVVTDDCNDASPTVFGAEAELCDGIDNNCNGMTDEVHGSIAWYPDDDGDGFGAPDPARVQVSCTVIAGFTTRAGDCDDTDRDVNPAAHETCNGRDDDCNGRADYRITPGDTEDDDGDGYADHTCGGNDCDDARAFVHPGAPELTDMIDDDCNGATDETSSTIAWYLDLDHDGYGDDASAPMTSATPIAMRVPRGGDCDDGDVFVHPTALDRCDGRDDDCDGTIDEAATLLAYYGDADDDGYAGGSGGSVMLACSPPASGSLQAGDCDDTRSDIHPGAPEICDSLDDDCDTTVDEDPVQIWYVDLDGDGHGSDIGMPSCTPIAGRVTSGDDCDDTNALRYPGRAETCNGGDDDCDTTVDEDAASACMGSHVASGVCTSGACVLTCATGFADCDTSVTTGCETNTAHSTGSCGACGVHCGPGDTCGEIAAPGVCDHAPTTQLIAGGYAVFALRSTGEVAVWGDDSASELGDSGVATVFAPRAASFAHIAEVAVTAYNGCARTLGGSVLCWGHNYFQPAYSPTTLPLPGPAVSVCVSQNHACAVLADGQALCAGDSSYGRMGDGTDSGVHSIPTPIEDGPGIAVRDAISVSCSDYSTCVLRQTATGARYVSCMGDGAYGALGNGMYPAESVFAVTVVGLPTDLVALNRGTPYNDACVRDSAGRVYCWGYANAGRLGLGAGAANPATPVTPPGLDAGVVDVMLTYDGGCAIRLAAGGAREALCWGADSNGTGVSEYLGAASNGTTAAYVPTLIADATGPIRDAIALTRGFDFSCVSRASGGVWCAGATDVNGQLGDGPTAAPSSTFVRTLGLD